MGDHRRVVAGDTAVHAAAGGGPTPSRLVAGKELLDRVHGLFTDDERQVADLRAQGLAWAEVADRLGGTAQARRMQLARAAERVARQLGLEESDQ